MMNSPLPSFLPRTCKDGHAGLLMSMLFQAATLYSLLMLEDNVSQASLRSLFERCMSIFSP